MQKDIAATRGGVVTISRTTGISPDGKSVIVSPDATCVPILENAQTLTVSWLRTICCSNGLRRLFAVVGDGVVRTLDGAPKSDGTLQWDSVWTKLDLDIPDKQEKCLYVVESKRGVTLTLATNKGTVWVAE